MVAACWRCSQPATPSSKNCRRVVEAASEQNVGCWPSQRQPNSEIAWGYVRSAEFWNYKGFSGLSNKARCPLPYWRALQSKRSDCSTTTGLSVRRFLSRALMTDARSVLNTLLGQVSTRPKNRLSERRSDRWHINACSPLEGSL